MKFDCGESISDEVTRLTTWHQWFAWRPVFIASHDCRWMERVKRRLVQFYPGRVYEYRALGKDSGSGK